MYNGRFYAYPVSAAEKLEKRIYKLTENFCVLKRINRKNYLFLRHTPKIFRFYLYKQKILRNFLKGIDFRRDM